MRFKGIVDGIIAEVAAEGGNQPSLFESRFSCLLRLSFALRRIVIRHRGRAGHGVAESLAHAGSPEVERG